MLFIALVAIVVVLSQRGRLGPLLWDPNWRSRPHRQLTAPSHTDAAERTLASRLADGAITSDEYLERLSLIQSR